MKEKHNLSEQRRAKKIKDGIDCLRELLEVGASLQCLRVRLCERERWVNWRA